MLGVIREGKEQGRQQRAKREVRKTTDARHCEDGSVARGRYAMYLNLCMKC